MFRLFFGEANKTVDTSEISKTLAGLQDEAKIAQTHDVISAVVQVVVQTNADVLERMRKELMAELHKIEGKVDLIAHGPDVSGVVAELKKDLDIVKGNTQKLSEDVSES